MRIELFIKPSKTENQFRYSEKKKYKNQFGRILLETIWSFRNVFRLSSVLFTELYSILWGSAKEFITKQFLMNLFN